MFTPQINDPVIFHKKDSIEQYWIDRARRNPVDFITYMTDGQKPPKKHHKKWLRGVFDKSIQYLIIESWPSSAKTSILVWSLAFLIGNAPWLTHIIASVSEAQATQRLYDLKLMMQDDRYKNVFPHVHIDDHPGVSNNATVLNIWSSRWKDGSEVDYKTWKSLISRYGDPRDDTVFACGISSKSVTGRRVSGWLVIDDPHNETNSATSEQRTKVTQAIKKEFITRWQVTSPFIKIIIIMTPWAEDDCAGQLMQELDWKGNPVWVMIRTPFFDEKGEPAWPENFTPDQIGQYKYLWQMGEIVFNLMYMLIPTAMAGRKITLDMLRKEMPSVLPEWKDITIPTDFAESKGLQSDYTVFYAVGRDTVPSNPNFYLMKANRFQEDQIHLRVDALISFCDECLEEFGRLDNVLFEPDSKPEMQMLQQKRPDIPCVMLQLHGDKELRFRRPAGMIQQGRFYFNPVNKFNPAIFSELVSFPMASHDDCIDPLSQLFEQPGWMPNILRSGIVNVRSPNAR